MTVRQIEFLNTKHGADVPLVLMNSIHTDEKTRKALAKYKTHNITVYPFVQVTSSYILALHVVAPESKSHTCCFFVSRVFSQHYRRRHCCLLPPSLLTKTTSTSGRCNRTSMTQMQPRSRNRSRKHRLVAPPRDPILLLRPAPKAQLWLRRRLPRFLPVRATGPFSCRGEQP